MEDYYLTQEELSALFGAIYERDMAALRKQKAELEAQLSRSLSELHAPPWRVCDKLDKNDEPL